ncbi:SidE phosphodiesterase domain-containing protein [Legionella bononiensis]|uniref:SidE PDE domain-containing protein n=1 Tax=Legionella bononiensis TaxID=2793102 RepID=A0ABS1WF75_9GAMM|nr:SidE phosphodiesterase domain-containing protein [Legionella bononiensis]MBL7479276.1 hypothetical protein [Legionella bononiensis]MBL7527996.1 hypothetical protein [Legionella bononiensis]MBL7563927.1 hypothetical protein [Legionella bononiensis]
MFTIKLDFVDSNIVALNIQNEFQKYIKTADLDALNHILTRFLKEINYSSVERLDHLKVGMQLNLELTDDQFKELKNLLVIGPDREHIELPLGLEFSVEFNRPILIAHRKLTEFIAYWKLPNAEFIKYQLFQLLSEDIIEVPYVDKPLEYDVRWNKFAFRPNHGTTHSIRLVKLLNTALKSIRLIAIELPAANVLNPVLTLTDEEKSCLELALFLYRSGRTNEMGWSSDPDYSVRSAEIFRRIALKLEYDTDLVHAIVSSFDYKSPIPMVNHFLEPLTEGNRIKIGVFKQLFKLVHNADLIRCFSSLDPISKQVKSVFYILLGPIDDALLNELTHQTLVLAAKYCKQTGASVVVKELQAESMGTYSGNPYAMVNTVADVKKAFIDLCSIDFDWSTLISDKNKTQLDGTSEHQVNTVCSSSSENNQSPSIVVPNSAIRDYSGSERFFSKNNRFLQRNVNDFMNPPYRIKNL